MVLRHVLVILVATGCSQSLFDSHGSTGSNSGDDGAVPATCQAPCVGDAAGDFDGSMAGSTGNWRYLDDNRNRTWTPMTASDNTMTGVDPANTITTCAAHGDAPVCQLLPGALLVSSSGSGSTADPAVELTVATSQIVQVSLLVRVPDGAPSQVIRLYRNSREDVLFTGTATAGSTLENAITLDAIAGDRFLVAVAPSAAGATNVGLQMFVSGSTTSFPSKCQLAIPFASATGNTVANLCGGVITHEDATDNPSPPVLGAGPYAEEGMAASIAIGTYYQANSVLDKSGDFTEQLWINIGTVGTDSQWAISDYDLDNTGGLGVVFYIDTDSALKMEVSTCTQVNPTLQFDGDKVAYPTDGGWHFVRVVHTGGNVLVCIDGARAFSFPLPAGKLTSSYAPYIGKNVIWTPAGAFYGGSIDDIRVFSTALPCQ